MRTICDILLAKWDKKIPIINLATRKYEHGERPASWSNEQEAGEGFENNSYTITGITTGGIIPGGLSIFGICPVLFVYGLNFFKVVSEGLKWLKI